MHDESTPKGDLVKLQRQILSEADARAMLERIRWPEGVRCVHCGSDNVGRVETKGKTYTRPDGSERTVPARHLFKCKAKECRKQFSVTKGTIFEDSKIPLTTWITVMYRMCSSKKGISALQIQREFGLFYEAAWFMCHRIRWAMTEKRPALLMGIVEADETYVGGKPPWCRPHSGDRIVLGWPQAPARRHSPPRRCWLPEPVRSGTRLPPQHARDKRCRTVYFSDGSG